MVSPDNIVFLKHIKDSGNKCLQFTEGYDFKMFSTDEKTISSVLREISVIGEAARRTTDQFREKHPEIPWEKIFAMRNRVVHDYLGVQLDIVWQTLQEDIPELLKIVKEIIEAES